MVNLGGGPALILGLFLAIAGAGLFFLRSVRPELARDYDIFFAAVGLLCGVILVFNGWRLEPILQFSQFLLAGTATFFAFESIRLRAAATEQARRNTTTVDRDRPVSRTRVYTEAELDKFDGYDNVYENAEPNYNSPRLRGYDDPQPRSRRPSRTRSTASRSTPTVDIRDEPRGRRPSRNRPEPRDYPPQEPARNRANDDYSSDPNGRRSRRPPAPARDVYDEWDDTPKTPSRPRRRPPTAPVADDYNGRATSFREDSYDNSTTSRESRRPRPADLGRSYEPEDSYDRDYGSEDLGRSYGDTDLGRSYDDDASIPGDYVVDYQPLDNMGTEYSDDDEDDYNRDDYDDYESSTDVDSEADDDDDYNDRPERRQPINLNNNKDRDYD